ncbi:MAG: hypothetical protein H7138_24760 [Myxococcales bacterium]|nr:hypothetical protein [Myxococcales bacterium]
MARNEDNGDNDDRKVKDLLDPATRAELERWFSVPSFEQLADRGVRPQPPREEDVPEVAALLKARANALASVDPALLGDHIRRMDLAAGMIKPLPPLELRADPTIASVNFDLIDRQRTIAEPRAYERSSDIEDDLRDCTPQALLRDLHRSELAFDKTFELVDPAADQRLDGIAVAHEMMATDWRAPAFATFATELGRTAFDELRAVRRQPWAQIQVTKAVTE